MSGDPKTLTSAQEGVLVALVEMELDAQNAGGLERGALGEFLLDFARRAVEAVGAPVVARDEAAELRAAIREWVEADRAWYETAPPLDVDEIDELGDRSLAADLALYRLAGANTESKDATRAEGGKPHPERSDALLGAYLAALEAEAGQ